MAAQCLHLLLAILSSTLLFWCSAAYSSFKPNFTLPVSWDKLRVQPKCAWQHAHTLELHFSYHPLHLKHPAPQCTGHPPGTKELETEVVVANSGLEG
jgi:hypothetical protein